MTGLFPAIPFLSIDPILTPEARDQDKLHTTELLEPPDLGENFIISILKAGARCAHRTNYIKILYKMTLEANVNNSLEVIP